MTWSPSITLKKKRRKDRARCVIEIIMRSPIHIVKLNKHPLIIITRKNPMIYSKIMLNLLKLIRKIVKMKKKLQFELEGIFTINYLIQPCFFLNELIFYISMIS